MKAVQLVSMSFLHRIMGDTLVLMSNNATAVVYLKKQEGTVSQDICSLAQRVVDWSELRMVSMTIKYIPKKNMLADHLSCPDQIPPMEWSFLPWIFSNICREFDHPHMTRLPPGKVQSPPFTCDPFQTL